MSSAQNRRTSRRSTRPIRPAARHIAGVRDASTTRKITVAQLSSANRRSGNGGNGPPPANFVIEKTPLPALQASTAALDTVSADTDVLAGSMFTFAADIVAEKRQLPLAAIVLQADRRKVLKPRATACSFQGSWSGKGLCRPQPGPR